MKTNILQSMRFTSNVIILICIKMNPFLEYLFQLSFIPSSVRAWIFFFSMKFKQSSPRCKEYVYLLISESLILTDAPLFGYYA